MLSLVGRGQSKIKTKVVFKNLQGDFYFIFTFKYQVQIILDSPHSSLVSAEESTLGRIDYDHVVDELSKQNTGKRKKYKLYSEKDRLVIAKYSLQHGPRKTARKFQKQYPSLNESTVRTFVIKYKTLIEIKARTSQSKLSGRKGKAGH